MKSILKILFLVLAAAIPAWSQAPGDSSNAKPETASQGGKHIVDENADGIDDKVQEMSKGTRRGKDKFIDKDGDGICDGRESGLGFRGGRSNGGPGKGGGRQWRGGKK